MKTTIFITGVCGVGKTSLIKPLKELLGSEFEVHDFDERGVPNNAGHGWRLAETQYWIGLGLDNSKKGLKTIVCGFARPSEISDNSAVGFILLDATAETIRKRLLNRYQTPESIETIQNVSGKTLEQFIDDNANFSSTMRTEAGECKVDVIDTNTMNPVEVAQKVADILKKL